MTPGQTLYIYVGGQGGYNGGGYASWGGYGGGASDVRSGGAALGNRAIVAGGGGSAGGPSCSGGAGGGSSGSDAPGCYCYSSNCGYGGTGTAGGVMGGSLGSGGSGLSEDGGYGGGGGGGYYGGGGTQPDSSGDDDKGGGGGSGYIGGVSSGTMSSGIRAGNGLVTITVPGNSDSGTCWSNCTQNNPTGNFETATTTQIKGWGCDEDAPGTNMAIHFYFYNSLGTNISFKATGTGVSRPDVQSANHCTAISTHGFEYNPQSDSTLWNTLYSYRANRPFTVKAFGINIPSIPPGSNAEILSNKTFGGYCGDGAIQSEFSEVCDSANMNGKTCLTQTGYVSGTLACNAGCESFNTSGCYTCGNGVKEGPEACDSGANNGTYGYCNSTCTAVINCGDGILTTPNEVCDGANLNGQTCATRGIGASGGTLYCNGSCNGYTTTSCTRTYTCSSLPSNASWYNGTASYSFDQYYTGSSWPTVATGYAASPASGSCQYKCNSGYGWTGTACLLNPVTIGTGTGTQYPPLSTYYNYIRSDAIYTAAEIGRTGTISQIAWNISNTHNTRDATLNIYLRTTTGTTPSTTWSITGATLVYSTTTYRPTATGWRTLTLSTPFNYTGNNLEVLVTTNISSFVNGGSTYYTTTGSAMHASGQSDGGWPTVATNTSRPNIKITFQ